jgi:hypothetical protein
MKGKEGSGVARAKVKCWPWVNVNSHWGTHQHQTRDQSGNPRMTANSISALSAYQQKCKK